jgi:short-subunit dehydrogenase
MVAAGKVKVSVLCPAWVKTRIADAGRNRPGGPAAAREPTQQEQMMEAMVRAAVASGIPPEVVADKVCAAVRDGSFYILTHSNTKKTIEKRMRSILDGTTPELELPGA